MDLASWLTAWVYGSLSILVEILGYLRLSVLLSAFCTGNSLTKKPARKSAKPLRTMRWTPLKYSCTRRTVSCLFEIIRKSLSLSNLSRNKNKMLILQGCQCGSSSKLLPSETNRTKLYSSSAPSVISLHSSSLLKTTHLKVWFDHFPSAKTFHLVQTTSGKWKLFSVFDFRFNQDVVFTAGTIYIYICFIFPMQEWNYPLCNTDW